MKSIIKVLKEALHGFIKDQLYLHASSLTFYTLLSIVPIFAVAVGFAKGFGFEEGLEAELYSRFAEHSQVVGYVLAFSRSLLQQAENSYISGVGVVFLFLFVLSLFWTIEASMNAIWKVARSRTPLRMLTDYLAMMVICPFIFVIASSLTVSVTSEINQAVQEHEVLKTVTPFLYLFYRGISLVLIWLMFSCIYLVMPNTKVKLKYAFLSAFIAGTIYYFVQIGMLKFQIGVSQYNAIYGSFAALPLFLFWLQISWLLVLLGAEIAYHAEHLSPTLFHPVKDRVEVTEQMLAVLLMDKITNRFEKGEKPWELKELSSDLGIPESYILEIMERLIGVGLISNPSTDHHTISYQPAKDLRSISLHSILQAINLSTRKLILTRPSGRWETIQKRIEQYNTVSEQVEPTISTTNS